MPLNIGAAPITFVGGKGGVGKTTVAAALGLRLAASGQRVLVVSTDPAHSLGDIFDARLGDSATILQPGLHGMEIDAEREVERYLQRVAGHMRDFVQPAMYGEIERQMELTRHAPGAAEAALLDRVATLMESARREYDRVIFDTAPTGHTLRLLALPEIMSAWTDGLIRSRDRADSFGSALQRLRGRDAAPAGDELSMIDQVRERPEDARAARIRDVLLERRRTFTRARRLLLDPAATAFLLVLIPEKLPILETAKARDALRRHDLPVAGIIVNRVLPDSAEGDFLAARRVREADYLARIDREFADLPRLRIPMLPGDVADLDALRAVAAHLPVPG
jgi:arsenite/tail-anchored protein-transporting ATPase